VIYDDLCKPTFIPTGVKYDHFQVLIFGVKRDLNDFYRRTQATHHNRVSTRGHICSLSELCTRAWNSLPAEPNVVIEIYHLSSEDDLTSDEEFVEETHK